MRSFMDGSSSGRKGVADPPEMMGALAQRVRALRAALESSEGERENVVAVLGSYERRQSEIEAAMRPIQAAQIAHDNIDGAIKAANDILAQVLITREAEATILKGPHQDLESYLKAVGHLKEVADFFSLKENFKSCERFLNDINILLSKSSLMIEGEFKKLMITHSKPVDPDLLLCWPSKHQWASDGDAEASGGNSGDSKHPSKSLATAIYMTPILIIPRILSRLHALAQQLIQDGNQQSCYRIYRDARSSALGMSLQKLGVEKLSNDDVERMQLDALEAKIGKWTQFMRIAMRLLLPGERKLCDEVFDGISFNKDQCFAELAGTGVLTLLSFGDAFAESKRSPEKLFVLMDMYEVMHELRPEIEVIFKDSFCSEIREAALGLMKLLKQTAQETFLGFEEVVEKDTSKTNVHDGTVHPLTIYVINHVKFLFDYQSTLKLLFQEFETGSDTEFELGVVLTKIMQALQNNLDGKSKQYKDPALMCIFLANNIHYMVMSVRRSEAKDVLGGDWIQRHRRIVQQNANQYKRVAWGKVVQTLSVQASSRTGTSRPFDQILYSKVDQKAAQSVRKCVESVANATRVFHFLNTMDESLISVNLNLVTGGNSFEELLGRPMEQTVPATCAIVSSAKCVQIQHKREYEALYGAGTFNCNVAAPRKVRQACRRGNFWSPESGARVEDVLNMIKRLGGLRTTNEQTPAPSFLNVHTWQIHAWNQGAGLSATRITELLDARGPFVGNLWVSPWYHLFDSSEDNDKVYKSGCARDPHMQRLCKKHFGKLVDLHSVVCFEYRWCDQDLHVHIFDNHDPTTGPQRWVHYAELQVVYTISVRILDRFHH